MSKKCEYKTGPGAICGAPGPNPCRNHDVNYLMRQLKHSDVTLQIIDHLLVAHKKGNRPFAKTLEEIETAVLGHYKGKIFNENHFYDLAEAANG